MILNSTTKGDLGINGSGTARPYMQPGEQEVLLTLLAQVKPKVMVEIGVNVGRTAQAVLREIDSIERYIGIDVVAEYQFEVTAQQIERPSTPGLLVKDDPRFKLLLRDRDTDLGKLVADVVFIDGDHGAHAVRQDSEWAAEVTREGGMVIWHDYGNPTVEVTEVLHQLKREGRELIHVIGTWLVYELR